MPAKAGTARPVVNEGDSGQLLEQASSRCATVTLNEVERQGGGPAEAITAMAGTVDRVEILAES